MRREHMREPRIFWRTLSPEVRVSAVLILCTLGALVVGILLNRQQITSQAESDARWSSVSSRPVSADEHMTGPEGAPVRVIVYTDLECPYCKIFHEVHLPRLKETYGDDINIVYRHYPLVNLHPTARHAAEAAECAAQVAGEPGFWAFVYQIFKSTKDNKPPSPESYESLIAQTEVEPAAFVRCMAERGGKARVDKDILDGKLAEVRMTPSEIIERDGRKILIAGTSPARVRATIELLLAEHRAITENR